jgi:hypothetical protein
MLRLMRAQTRRMTRCNGKADKEHLEHWAVSSRGLQCTNAHTQHKTRNRHARFHKNVSYKFSKVHDKDQVSMSTVKILSNYLPSCPRVRVISSPELYGHDELWGSTRF